MKYEFTEETITFGDVECRRIVACKDFGDVKKGDLGGYIADGSTLSQSGTCWIYEDSKVGNGCHVFSNAKVRDSKIQGTALLGNCELVDSVLCGNSLSRINISDNAYVCDSVIYENVSISGDAVVYKSIINANSMISDNARVYSSTFEKRAFITGNSLINLVECTGDFSIGGDSSITNSKLESLSGIISDNLHIRYSTIVGRFDIFNGCHRIYDSIVDISRHDVSYLDHDIIGMQPAATQNKYYRN